MATPQPQREPATKAGTPSPQSPKSAVSPKSHKSPKSPTLPRSPAANTHPEAPPQPAIEVDPDLLSDNDSAYDNDYSSYTTSLASSVYNYSYENGRRYHAYREGSYLFPNDEQENNRLDIFHHICLLLLGGKLHLAPIQHPQRILDVGTGTGIWAIEIADQYPSAEVVGNDLSPIQPQLVPPNVRFIVDDCEDDWLDTTPYDFIHARYLTASLLDWPKFVQRMFEHTTPGGWVELLDWDIKLFSDDGSLPPDSAMVRWDDLCIEAFEKLGREPRPGPLLKGHLERAGFANVREHVYRLPLGSWPRDRKLKELGTWNRVNIEDGMEGFVLAPLTRVLGWRESEVQVLLAQVRQELKNPAIHSYYNMWVSINYS